MTTARIVLTTTSSAQQAKRIALELVEHRLAACVNIVPRIESVYRWQHTVEVAEEWLLVIKTRVDAFASVCNMIKELHSYETPECVMLEISGASQEYLDWILNSTQ